MFRFRLPESTYDLKQCTELKIEIENSLDEINLSDKLSAACSVKSFVSMIQCIEVNIEIENCLDESNRLDKLSAACSMKRFVSMIQVYGKEPKLYYSIESKHMGPRSCDFWCWRDREDIDPRSKYVIPKLIEKLGELENLVESSQYIDNHASINEVEKVELNKFVEETSHEVDKPKESKDDNCVDIKLEKLEEEVEKIKEREKKWRRIAKFVVFCCSSLLIAISYWLGRIHIKKGSMGLP
ncbi:hypothetical protein FXO38_21896 [Capsicum annuum]|nr:hypothetical protein FXO38_21896 [Capsicum annuum]